MKHSRAGLPAMVALAIAGCGVSSPAERHAPPATSGPEGASASAGRPVRHGSVETVWFRSRALREMRRMLVYLPPGYRAQAARGRRYGVLYLLHAPPGDPADLFRALHTPATMDSLLARGRVAPMLVVVPFGKTRLFGSDTEWANARAGPYMSFVLDTVRAVDHRFATYRDRGHRAIAGLSSGGYGALNIALHHLGLFSVVESWSGYFVQEPTAAFRGTSPAELAANSPADYLAALAPRIRRLGLRVWIYQGRTEFINPEHLLAFAPALHAAGADVHFGWFRGVHSWGLWRRQLPRMLEAASAWFAQPPAVAARHPALVEMGRPLGHAAWHRAVFDNPRYLRALRERRRARSRAAAGRSRSAARGRAGRG